MSKKQQNYEATLTNEMLYKRFKSQFDLVNYAFKLAENMVISGRGPRVPTQCQNPAFQVLCEIAANRDILEDLPVPTKHSGRGSGSNSR
jgi:hypothetical protein